MSRTFLTVASLGVATASTACSTAPANADSGEGAPAVIVAPNASSRASLHDIVRKALARESVLLADDALTTESTLIVEPMRIRDPSGRLVIDSSVRVEHFQLLKRGDLCVLVHERTGQRYALSNTKCIPKL